MIKHIFFDFNGTIINDVELCLNLLNEFLRKQNKKEIDIDRYKEVFTFPIQDYYLAAGIDFSIQSFAELAEEFIKKYQPMSLKCGLYDGVLETIQYLKEKGIHIYILSASEKQNLLQQCRYYHIDTWFDEILGIDNIHAGSKMDIALEFIKKSHILPEEALFIGDTLHDYEVAKAMGIGCRLVSCGHQSFKRLEAAGVPIYKDIRDIRKEIENGIMD